jgi:hypothetical protein
MSDSCYCDENGGRTDGENRVVRLKFVRSQLLYDIKNYAYVEADVMGEEKQHAQHVLGDIGEEGNVDRVTRILAVVHSAARELLYPYTKEEPIEEEIDDCLFAPDEYIIEMRVPPKMSRTTVHLLSRLIHEFMVYCVMADWLSITNPDAAANWRAKAEATEDEIEKTKNQRGTFTRKTHPW